jgi:heme-degrading monooxygenase HmoA
MVISVTYIKLRKLHYFFRLSYHGMHIMKQAKSQKGFIGMKNTGFGYNHYTLSAWETKEDVIDFSKSGAHLNAMKEGSKLASEIRIFTFDDFVMPEWKEAKDLLFANGKVIKY